MPVEYGNGGIPQPGDIWATVPVLDTSSVLYRNIEVAENGCWRVDYRYNYDSIENWIPLSTYVTPANFYNYYWIEKSGPRIRKKSGFGSFITRIEDVSDR